MKCLIGIDESGITNAHYSYRKNPSKLMNRKRQQRYFSILILLISQTEFDFFQQKFKEIKLQIFKKEVILHTSDLFNHRKEFNHYSLNQIKTFVFGLLNLIEESNFKIFQVLVDTEKYYFEDQNILKDPYFLAINFIMKKIMKNYYCDLFHLYFESRDFLIDKILKLQILTNYHNNNLQLFFLKKKEKNFFYAIIELTDFISYLLFLTKIQRNYKYFNKLKFFKNENYQLVKMIEKILVLKYANFPDFYNFSYKKIN